MCGETKESRGTIDGCRCGNKQTSMGRASNKGSEKQSRQRAIDGDKRVKRNNGSAELEWAALR